MDVFLTNFVDKINTELMIRKSFVSLIDLQKKISGDYENVV